MTQSQNRLKWVDSLKGFAILLVVLGHIAGGYVNAGLFAEHSYFLNLVFHAIYSFHMPLFFVVSGYLFAKAYLISESNTIKKDRVKNQLLNLACLYLIWGISFGAGKVLLSGFTNEKVEISDIFMIWAKPMDLYWYLYVLIIAYLIFSIKFVRKLNPFIVLPVLAVVSAVVRSGLVKTTEWFSIDKLLIHIVYFYIGYLLCTTDFLKRIKPRYSIPALAVSIAGGGVSDC